MRGKAAGLVVFVTAGVLALSGCSATTQNVRAFKKYAEEEPNLKVDIDRVEDIAATLELVDRLISGTTYTPGDQWPKRIPLDDAEFQDRKKNLANRYPYDGCDTCEVPILKVYREHIEDALRDYGPPPEKAMYPSLLDAVAALGPRQVTLKDHYSAYKQATAQLSDATEGLGKLQAEIDAVKDEGQRKSRDPEFNAARLRVDQARAQVDADKRALDQDAELLKTDATLDTPQKEKIARDAFAVLSVVLRVELEALALLPIVTIEFVRSIPNVPRDMTVKLNLKIAKQVWDMPVYLGGLTEHFNRHVAAIEVMSSVLSKALKTSISDSPGMELSESIVDQIVGITIDSFRLDLNAGGNAFFYSAFGTGDRQSSNDKKTTYDYRGRQFKLDYRVDPIVFASARLDMTLDWIRLPGVANLGFGYSTDRVFKSGGEITNTSLVQQLGIQGPASDVIDAALGILGVQSSVRVANFNAGTLRQVSATDVSQVIDTAPLQLKQTQVDVGYDILWALNDPSLKANMEQLVVGGRFLQYTLPRIVYELKDVSRTAGEQHFAFFDTQTGLTVGRESPPQPVTSNYYMVGAMGRFGQGEAPRWSPWLDLGAYGGLGPTKFYFLRDTSQPDGPGNREQFDDLSFVFNGHAGLGLRWRIFPRAHFIRLDLRALYQADILYSKINHSAAPDGRATTTDFGTVDVFHGPSLFLRGSL